MALPGGIQAFGDLEMGTDKRQLPGGGSGPSEGDGGLNKETMRFSPAG